MALPAPPAQAPARAGSARVGTRPATVVVLDDHRENLDLISEVLDGGGYNLHTYEDPLEALRGMENHGADVLMTDLNMPGMYGMGVMQVVRRRWPHWRPAPASTWRPSAGRPAPHRPGLRRKGAASAPS